MRAREAVRCAGRGAPWNQVGARLTLCRLRRRVETFEYAGKLVTVRESHREHVMRLVTAWWLFWIVWFGSAAVFLYYVRGNWAALGLLWLPVCALYIALKD